MRVSYTLLLPILCPACALLYPTRVPIDALYYRLGEQASARTLLVLLPGRADDPEDYAEEGFIRAIEDSGLPVDAVAVDAHVGYYYSRSLLPRLLDDVVRPARRKGYRRIWIAGISMGGLGALLYAREHGDTIDGLLVMAPFLGDADVIEEIAGAGGLSAWAPVQPLDEDDYQRSLWSWLKRYAGADVGLPRLYIGWGVDDRLAVANDLLAEVLPKRQVFRVPGGHDWEPWRQIFRAFLETGALAD